METPDLSPERQTHKGHMASDLVTAYLEALFDLASRVNKVGYGNSNGVSRGLKIDLLSQVKRELLSRA